MAASIIKVTNLLGLLALHRNDIITSVYIVQSNLPSKLKENNKTRSCPEHVLYEPRSSGCLTRSDRSRSVQLRKILRSLKFRI